MPSVMPVTAGTIAAPASEVAICDAATAQKSDEVRAFWERYLAAADAVSDHGMYGRPAIHFRDEEPL